MAKERSPIEMVETLMSASQIGELFDCDREIVAREARKGKLPEGAAIMVAKRWLFDPAKLEGWEPPAKGVFGAKRREDGRRRYTLYLHEGDAEAGIPDEVAMAKAFLAEMGMPEDCFVNPRKRKAKAKAEPTAVPSSAAVATPEEQAEGDAFAEFALEE